MKLLFGVANSDHQCEAFDSAWPPDIRDGWELEHPRKNATRFWDLYRTDVDNAAELGCKIFRFSISWPRVQPLSTGGFSAPALQHYADHARYIRAKDMEPLVTLLHFSWPAWIQDVGTKPLNGLLSEEFLDRFRQYAECVADALPEVKYWCTINEPTGLIMGFLFPSEWHLAFPPGLDGIDAVQALEALIPNLFKAHARAYKVIKERLPKAFVGANPAVLGLPSDQKRSMEKELQAITNRDSLSKHVKRLRRSGRAGVGHYSFLGPLIAYHTTITSALSGNWWHLGMAGQLSTYLCPEECSDKQDYIGLDYYWGVNAWWRVLRIARLIGALVQGQYAGAPVWPQGLRQEINFLKELFRNSPKPMLILENGCVDSADGYSRERYLREHVAEVLNARTDGADVLAYICWSISTNRELGAPANPQSDFGLFHIDLDNDSSLARTSTVSALAYKELIGLYGK
jgi:beta-glucosidase/6-phospho-beta-glucosidase/beta-galactosidase